MSYWEKKTAEASQRGGGRARTVVVGLIGLAVIAYLVLSAPG